MTMTRGQIGLLAGFAALAPLAIDMYLPAMTPIAADLGVTTEKASLSVSVFLFGIAGGQLLAGPLSDRIGRRPLFLGGLALFAAAAAVAAMTTSFAMLLGARLVQALGACAAMVAGRAVVADRMDAEEGARFFSLLAMVGGLAPVLAPLLGALLIAVAPWPVIFWVMAGFAALLLAGALGGLPESRSAETAAKARGEHPVRAYLALLGERRLLGYLAAAMFNSAAFFSYVANSAVIFTDSFGFTPTQFALLFGLNSLALVGTAQLNRQMLKTSSADAVLGVSAGNAVLLAALLLIFAATQIGGWIVLALLLFPVVGSITPVQANAMAGGLAAAPLRGGACAALFGAAGFAGGALASSLASLLYDGTARGLCLVIAACLLGVALSIRLLVAPQPANR